MCATTDTATDTWLLKVKHAIFLSLKGNISVHYIFYMLQFSADGSQIPIYFPILQSVNNLAKYVHYIDNIARRIFLNKLKLNGGTHSWLVKLCVDSYFIGDKTMRKLLNAGIYLDQEVSIFIPINKFNIYLHQ